jgi:hypothetical protein
MKIINTIFYFPFVVYVFVLFLITIIKIHKKQGKLSQELFNQHFQTVLETKWQMRNHFSWIFWIIIALFITSLTT